jgi:hypothetical protein
MAAIASIETNVTGGGSFAAPIATLGSSDTITYKAGRKQLLVLRNPTGGTLTLNIDGDGASATFPVPGAATIDLTGGFSIAVGAGLSRAVVLSTISGYLQGVVTMTGASGLTAQLFDL